MKKKDPPGEEGAPTVVDITSDAPPSCCLCLDVRTGAVVIGLVNLVMHAAAFIVTTTVAMHRPETTSSDVNDPYYYIHPHHRNSDYLLQMLIACLSFVITAMFVYGASLRRSSYVLPFFCMQVFDMSIWILVSAATVNLGSRIKLVLENKPYLGDHVGRMSENAFVFNLMMVMTVILMIKAYMISVVWSCFKHCKEVEEGNGKQVARKEHPVILPVADCQMPSHV